MKTTQSVVAKIAVTFCCSLWYASALAQDINAVTKSFEAKQQMLVQEKIFVHTDKGAYMAGEILWFKIYCVDATYHRPLNLSKVVYIDVVDNAQLPALQAKIAIRNGIGSGSLFIPVTIANGNYKLRAYTSWMKNFSPEFYFEKQLTVINPLRSPETPVLAKSYDMQFFPEGGSLLNGYTSKVGFKLTVPGGGGANFSGAVIDQKNDTVLRFKPLKFGIGHFMLTPVAGNSYRAVIRIGSSKPFIKALPEAGSQGYVMQLTDDGSNRLRVTVSSTNFSGPVYLIAHTRQVVNTALNQELNNGKAIFIIDKDTLREGISHITVFNSSRQPVCERLYFKRPLQQLQLDAVADQRQYTLRKKVSIALTAKDRQGKALQPNLSLTVFKVDSLQDVEPGNIFNYLWLRSDLKGTIESPDYYFTTASAETNEALDNLLLTQGWRRFQWSQLLQNQQPAFTYLPEYDDHLITGKVINLTNNAPAKDVVAFLGVPGKRVQFYAAKSDSAGRVLFNTKQFYGANELVVQTNGERDSTYRVDIASPFSEQYSSTPLPALTITAGMQQAMQEHSVGMQVQNLYSGEKLRRFYDPQVDSSAFYGTPFKLYKLDDFTRFTTMEEVLREYIREVNVVRSQRRYHIKMLNDKGFLTADPLVLMDGVPVFNIDKAIAIDPLKVQKMEVIRERYFWGPSVQDGILSLTSYKGDLGGYEIDPKAVVIDYEGLQAQREFYSPVYDTEQQFNSRLPDFRNVLYWAPNITPTAKGSATLSFYTSDQPGKYAGIIQGITIDGQAASKTFTFEVK